MDIKEVLENEKIFARIIYQRDTLVEQLLEELEQKNKMIAELTGKLTEQDACAKDG